MSRAVKKGKNGKRKSERARSGALPLPRSTVASRMGYPWLKRHFNGKMVGGDGRQCK